MQKKLLTVLCCLSLLSGCYTTTQTVQPVKTNVTAMKSDKQVVIKDMERTAIFPMADYSKEQSFLQNPRYGVNLKIMQAVADELISRGITVANQEDVNTLLVKEGIIALIKKSGDVSTPEWELANHPHDKLQQANIMHMMSGGTSGEFSDNKSIDGVKIGLSKDKVREIGGMLGVDKIIRGQIIEYGFGETKSLNPANGLLAVILGGLTEGMGAFVYQESYEVGLPDTSWTTKYIYSNEMGLGAGANIPPKQANCYVQVRLFLQDVKDGSILWSNRVEIKYTPDSTLAYDDNHPKKMTDESISKGVTALMDDLFKDKKVRKKFLGLL